MWIFAVQGNLIKFIDCTFQRNYLLNKETFLACIFAIFQA
ncbi:hypothetical protein M23134_02074 [Microscilla marina ATCC 23134]|uniref:Uncharacterized protein n=1 Tax=Microscilla marina ATCC 23134 TaxID=313606 RepID=A1ZCP3_MICM2|nr:hypothetical protein M23134_02074 [Microscilla marina ATCC 23134]